MLFILQPSTELSALPTAWFSKVSISKAFENKDCQIGHLKK